MECYVVRLFMGSFDLNNKIFIYKKKNWDLEINKFIFVFYDVLWKLKLFVVLFFIFFFWILLLWVLLLYLDVWSYVKVVSCKYFLLLEVCGGIM